MTARAQPGVRLLGSSVSQTAFAVGNAEWRVGLEAAGVRLVDDETADVLIHHDYSQRFGDIALPPAGWRVAVRPWDFGPYPQRWADVVREQYDELWVFTDWGRTCAIEGGVEPERIRVIPLGVDIDVHSLGGPRHKLTTRAQTTFLFVGAAISRKGIDIALAAYLEAFNAADDVQLIVKDHTADVFYRDVTYRDDILRAAERRESPAIVYVDEYMPRDELAAIYRGADALVAPSRAEGWALPVLEAMACGTPAIVPEFGAFLSHCAGDGAVFVPTKRIRVPVRDEFTTNTLGFEEYVERVDFCETSPAAVADAMRDIASMSADVKHRRSVAARANAERFTWTASTAAIVAAISGVT